MLTDSFPRTELVHGPTPLEAMPNLSEFLGGAEILIKRDDCTGLAMGGNKTRQLEFYVGDALSKGADMLLTTGAVQSNHVRQTVAAARKLGLDCEVQLEERVSSQGPEYYRSGNPFLVGLMGAKIRSYPVGEDEDGADRALHERAAELKAQGKSPYVIALSQNHVPLGSLGYVKAAEEILDQLSDQGKPVDAIVLASGSGSTHAGLLTGLRAKGSNVKVYGFCVRRAKDPQIERVYARCQQVAEMIGKPGIVSPDDVCIDDHVLAPGYGQLNEGTREALRLVAVQDGILLDPTYTAKAMAGLISLVRSGELGAGKRVVFLHTGGTPALFGYPELVWDD